MSTLHTGGLVPRKMRLPQAPSRAGATPWSDVKVAFDYEPSTELLWMRHQKGQLHLPAGWELCETVSNPAFCFAIFRVDGVPTVEDGVAVRAELYRLGRLDRRNERARARRNKAAYQSQKAST